jgi:ribosomal protein S18 acetylase RimI-like enzyme
VKTEPNAEVQPARLSDARDLHAMLTEAFADSYLKFSVYQTPAAAGYLEEQLAGAASGVDASFFVLKRGGILLGFYQATVRSQEYFLGYIASSAHERGRGVGRLLLEHFEATGAARGCAVLGLEAYRSNAAAVAWYERHGYRTLASRHVARFELGDFSAEEGPGLEVESSALEQALDEEASRGFSSVECGCSGQRIQLGLIGGTICNVMDPAGTLAVRAAPSVARRFANTRRWLLTSGPAAFAGMPAPESQEESLHMTKTLGVKDAA